MRKFLGLGVLLVGLSVSSLEAKNLSRYTGPELLTEGAHREGDEKAPVKIVVFQDIHCGMCGKSFRETIPAVRKEYVEKGLVQIVFRDFPLGMKAEEVAIAGGLRCAAKQGKYMEFTARLYNQPKESKAEFLNRNANYLGLNLEAFDKCLADKTVALNVKKDHQEGLKLGVDGTPTFYINGLKVEGAVPFEAMKPIINEELALKKSIS